jgi:cytoplasmic iron level regulating protein YaaA (DUF328/UPF0246 family)
MLILLSPAKKLREGVAQGMSNVIFPDMVQALGEVMRSKSSLELQNLMHISEKLGDLNAERYQNFQIDKHATSGTAAVATFYGDVYRSMDYDSLDATAQRHLHQHLRILSGMYGCLRATDGIMPHRLEMGTRLRFDSYNNLYEYWGEHVTAHLNAELKDHSEQFILNLASQEYSKVIQQDSLQYPMITCDFKEWKDGKYKTIGIFAKRARGLMARYLAENDIQILKAVKAFDVDGYAYNEELSSDVQLIFTRKI